jgi:hypothetical protein
LAIEIAKLVDTDFFVYLGEFLFPPYSVFEILETDFHEGNAFQIIHLRAVVDNALEDLDLPVAPWG